MNPQEIEKRFGIHLEEEQGLEKLMKSSARNAYTLDESNNIIGLNLWSKAFKSITVPKSLDALQYLNVSENEELEILIFESGLPALETLDVSECTLKELSLPPGFDSLHTIHAQQNKLNHFRIEEACPNLKYLDLAGNQIQTFSLPLGLSQLEILYLQGGNKVTDISFLKGSNALQTLNISGNAVQDLSALRHLMEKGVAVKWKKSGSGILVEECPLGTPPPEIVKEGNRAILNYFEEQDKQGTDTLYEAKLLILGEGGAGKTSLCSRLLYPEQPLPSERDSTKGIDIHQYTFPLDNGRNFRVNVWDFGGQEIYHATHQFFLTKRSLYILLDDTKKDSRSVQDEGFKYWLEVIDLLGGDSPVLIFQNEKAGRSKKIDLAGIKGRFENVKDSYRGNLEFPEAVNDIKEAINHHVRQLPHIGQSLPKKWIDIRNEIEQLADKKPYISHTQYFDIYKKHLDFDREKALQLSRYLHDLGVFLHFQDDPLLKRIVILQNAWATEAVFKIIDDEVVKEKMGRFDESDCQRLWSDSVYADMHPELLKLMIKFELAYQLVDTIPLVWLAPQLLQPSKPETLNKWEKAGDLELRYHYDFLPKGLINRLMVRKNRYVQQPSLGWKNGVLFEQRDTQLLAQLTVKGDEVILRARGPECKDLLNIISADLDALNDSFSGLQDKVAKKIPCICPVCRKSTSPEFYEYEELKRRRELNKKTIECRVSFEDVSVYDLLEGFQADKDRMGDFIETRAEKATGMKVFFSYSKHDREFLDQFLVHLSGLKRKGKITAWEDSHILPGEEWDDKVKSELAEADIIFLLVSSDFLNTDYIWDVEIKEAMKRHDCGEARVIPIILRPCDWEGMPFSKLNGLPYKGKPVADYASRDQAWVETVKKIEQLMDLDK